VEGKTDTVFVILEYDWYFTVWLVRRNKAAGGFFGFQKVTQEPAGQEGNLQHDI
jgi:hypothetical protein